uniref:Sugar ABC transporter substrate-binding protein n=1 Tax=Thermosporothrix sp. COM3 TaxID=2490863 RepID=A0A455SGU9_9CHLR|nr:sugar ABC transporter substrate-binding protein [Thermosporothrix sp. COM3]
MKLRGIFLIMALFLLGGSVLAACGEASTGSANELTFWAAPNPPQQAFWDEMAKEYMAQHPDIKITVKAIPESPTSEAGIQSALAGGTAPTASENIFTGFGGQLKDSDAIVPLDQMPGWNDLIKARHMESSIAGWKWSDGHTYILPMYTNPMLFAWRSDILKELGYSQPPRTYSEVLKLGEKLKQKYPDKFVWARQPLMQDTWYERWFDFFTFYDAASNGKPLITGDKITADDQAAVGTLNFFKELNDKKLLLTQSANDPFENGLSVANLIGPWSFAGWQEKYPDLKYGKTFVLAPPPVPDNVPANQPVKTFADAKGIVMYKQASEEQQQKMWDFLKWVLSDPAHDMKWMQKTSLPPARDDLNSNAEFKAYFAKQPELQPFAENIPNAVPPLTASKYTDIQLSLGTQAIIPVLKHEKQPEQGWESWKKAVQPMIP